MVPSVEDVKYRSRGLTCVPSLRYPTAQVWGPMRLSLSSYVRWLGGKGAQRQSIIGTPRR